MALSGTVNTSDYHGRYVSLSWSATQSLENNSSTISWSLYGAGEASAAWYMAGNFYVSIAGNVVCNWSSTDRITLYNGTYIASGSLTLVHDSDGSKSFSVEVAAGIYNYDRNCYGSATVTLDTLARASVPSCITYPDTTQNVGNMGSSIIIHMNRKSSSFTHTVRYSWYTTSGTIATGVGDNTQWTIPLSFANYVPSNTSGWGTIYVDTYNGSTKVGTESCQFTTTVPSSIVPSITSSGLSIVNSNSTIQGWGLCVAGYSSVKLTASASGSYSSSIASYSVTGSYSTTSSGSSLNYTGGTLNSSGTKYFYITAKDSRGRSSSTITKSVTVYSYSQPTISSFSVQRNSSSSTKAVVAGSWSYASVNSKNSASAKLYYKKSTDSSWTTYGTIFNNMQLTLSGPFSEESSYVFKVVVTDAVGNTVQSETTLPTIAVLLDFKAGGKGLGVGKIAEADKMEVALDTTFYGNVMPATGASIVGTSILDCADNSTQIQVGFNSIQSDANYLAGYVGSGTSVKILPVSVSGVRAVGVADYGNTNHTIKIGYAGSSLTSCTYLAAYGSNGDTIKDISLSTVRSAMGISSYVTSTGTSGSWMYRKWSNDFKECWYRGSLTTDITACWGSGVYIKTGLGISYPFSYTSTPTVVISVTTPGKTVWPIVANDTNTSAVYYYLFSSFEQSSITYIINVYVYGK